MTESLYERLDALHGSLAELIEEMGATIYHAIESDTLKAVAIAAGVDHTREGTVVIEALGLAIQRERDIMRELRRQHDADRKRAETDDQAIRRAHFAIRELLGLDGVPMEERIIRREFAEKVVGELAPLVERKRVLHIGDPALGVSA